MHLHLQKVTQIGKRHYFFPIEGCLNNSPSPLLEDTEWFCFLFPENAFHWSLLVNQTQITFVKYDTMWVVNTSIVFSCHKILATPTPLRTNISPSNRQKLPLWVKGTSLAWKWLKTLNCCVNILKVHLYNRKLWQYSEARAADWEEEASAARVNALVGCGVWHGARDDRIVLFVPQFLGDKSFHKFMVSSDED